MDSSSSIIIDAGSTDAGGQVLRNAIALSALLTKPVVITNILMHRDPPGLKNQHRRGLLLSADIASAQVIGAIAGSTQVDFRPGSITLPQRKKVDIGSAGSISLILQVALPLFLFSPCAVDFGGNAPTHAGHEIVSSLTVTGGTNTPKSPQVDYIQRILFPFLETHFGTGSLRLVVKKRGYIPRGGGEVTAEVQALPGGRALRPIQLLTRGQITSVHGVIHHPGFDGVDEITISKSIRDTLLATQLIAEDFGPINLVSIDSAKSRSPGCGVVLWARSETGSMIGGTALGGTGAGEFESVVKEAAENLIRGLRHGGCVDEDLQDQVIIFMALAEGVSKLNIGKGEMTIHTRTVIEVIEKVTGAKFAIERQEGTVIRCEGIGFKATKQCPLE